MRLVLLALLLGCSQTPTPRSASVEETIWYERPLPLVVDAIALPSGETLRYGRIVPDECEQPGACPVLIALPGGAQNENLMEESLRPWAQSLHDHQWIVLSPIADDALFFEGGERLLPPFLDRMAERYLTSDGRFLLFGVSNGGLSAFRIATLEPERFRGVVVAPGFARTDDQARLRALRETPVVLFVGERDRWLQPTEVTYRSLREAGVPTTLRILPNRGHNLATLPWADLHAALLGENDD
ncbi:MAG: hypothetical protein AAGE52_14795 [Myxococcota bacterium]